MTELESRLRQVRTAIASGDTRHATNLAVRALREAEEHPSLAVLSGLVSRDLAHPGATEKLIQALADGKGLVKDRVAGWVALAEAADAQHFWAQADSAWEKAVTESGGEHHLVLARAGALLRAGRGEDAVPLLTIAAGSPDSLVALAAWLLLSGLHIEADRLDPCQRAAEHAMGLARERHNWLAYSAAVIDQSEVCLRREDPAGALDILLKALQICRQRGDPGSLLVARVHEVQTK